jgi:SAM-dependent methyltransferase
MLPILQVKGFIKTILPKRVVNKIQGFIAKISISRIRGFNLHLDTPDRYVLEDIIIPYFVERNEFHKILFVGCDWYTKPYNNYFKNKEYWTIEIDETRKKHGSKRHIIDSLLNLSNHFTNNYFDVIVYNGVFGWGINSREDTETSFQQCFQCLRPGGILVFGWNDIPEYKPFPVIEECKILQQFEPYFFSPLSTVQYSVPDKSDEQKFRHVFNFYMKPLPERYLKRMG